MLSLSGLLLDKPYSEAYTNCNDIYAESCVMTDRKNLIQ